MLGSAARISYNLTDAEILDLVPVGSDIVQFVPQSQGAYWMARVEELRSSKR